MNLALFDFDGTVTHADSFTAFVLFATDARRVARGMAAIAPSILGYYLRTVPAPRLRALMIQRAFAGRSAREVRELGERFAATSVPRLVRPRALERMRWHLAHGDRVAVVSASLSPYLEPWCRSQGVELSCSELEAHAGILTGEYAGKDCTGAEKAARVRAKYRLAEYAEVYAYGDSAEDRALLALATRSFFRWSAFE